MNLLSLRAFGISCLLFLIFTSGVNAQDKEVFKKKGFILTFINQDPAFSPLIKAKMIETFFQVYPLLKKEYNSATAKNVTFVIDTAYKGVAATSGNVVSFSPLWFRQHPDDIDVVTHEVMHIVQDYGSGGGPWWVTEGIADYVRYKFGVGNAAAKWTLTPYKAGQNYDNGYRITARFLAWLEKSGHAGLVKALDASMRSHTYSDELWKRETKKTLQELWAGYIADPAL